MVIQGRFNNRLQEVLQGTAGDDDIYPNGGWDVVQGNGGFDTVYVQGLAADFKVITEAGVTYVDALTGASAGNERTQLYEVERIQFTDQSVELSAPQGFVGGAGNDTFIGNAGLDTAQYAAPRSQFQIEKVGDFHFVTDLAGTGGVDRLQSIERISFADGKIALDFSGAARDAARLVGTLLGPQAVKGSIQSEQLMGKVLAVFDQGQTLSQVAQTALTALGWDHRALLEQMFINLLGRQASPDELSAVVAQFQATPVAELAVLACNVGAADASIGLMGLTSSGLPYA